ncbi:hypothetical protein ACFY4C_41080 [Actinomadura viridis]|uniref:hypothetical protein n=1 Tax=Actinomadura viridis TaxID=58110 RepID=UPI0036B108DE
MAKKSKQERKAALQRLREARRRLEEVSENPNHEPWIAVVEGEQANQEVAEAERDVWFGSQRGWKY